MSPKLLLLFLALLLLQLTLLRPAMAAEPREDPGEVGRIDWLVSSPLSVGHGKLAERSVDRLVAFMGAHWPEVEHRLVIANPKRSWRMLAAGERACKVASLRTPEREKLAYFTETQRVRPMQIAVRRDRLAQIPRNAAGEVLLAELLAARHLRGAAVEGRSYGPHVDRLLKQRPRHARLDFYVSADFGSHLLRMLLADRADYALEYDFSTSHRDEDGRLAQQLVSLPIHGATALLSGGIACPRNAWGLAAIRGIDKVLGTPAGAEMLRQSTEEAMPAEQFDQHREQVDEFFRERARPSVIR